MSNMFNVINQIHRSTKFLVLVMISAIAQLALTSEFE